MSKKRDGSVRKSPPKPQEAQSKVPISQHPAQSSARILISRLQRVKSDLRSVLHVVRRAHSERPPINLGGRWGAHIPRLARTCADMVEHAPTLFSGLPFSAEELRELAEEVREIGEIQIFIQSAAETLACIASMRKEELHGRTMTIVEQVSALQRMPLLPPEQRSLLAEIAAPIDHILQSRRSAIRSTRKTNQSLRTKSQSEVEETRAKLDLVELENQVLRGIKLSRQSLAPSAKLERKSARASTRSR